MPTTSSERIFTPQRLAALFPPERADAFFDALYGDAEDGAYDIALAFEGERENGMEFSFRLTQRPGHCLACNLTYGLPQVFERHPVIDLPGVVAKIASVLDKAESALQWRLLPTREMSRTLHVIPLVVTFG
ncbi:pancreas/duodenum homeobox protein 1 [Nitratidesulfovibrio sp.]|uniref:pancreas/duodenum homeobox protein 1 n=1 Tax=Nitratidesulfovibrio sp. TaxID=2802297 RepID=UPI0033405555